MVTQYPTFKLFILSSLAVVVISLGLMLGSTRLTLSSATFDVIFSLRVHRVFSAFIVGGMLALAGAFLQILLRNPLAEPYTLGISGGAVAAMLMVSLFGVSLVWRPSAAWVGAVFSMVLLYLLTTRKTYFNPSRLLLFGIMLSAGWGALIALLLTLVPQHQLSGEVFWLMGDLSQVKFPYLETALLVLILLLGLKHAKALNVLRCGELKAKSLGVDVSILQKVLFIYASLLTASAVSLAGMIGFIGLIVPRFVRAWVGVDHRVYLLMVSLTGGILLTLADLLARTVIAPAQLPVGIITALIGVPVFIAILLKDHGLR